MQGNQATAEPQDQDARADQLQPGETLLQGQYCIERYLASGGFGVTYLARDSLDRAIVLKECFPSTLACRSNNEVRAYNRSSQQEFERVVRLFGQEARRLATLNHPNIVGIHQVFEDHGTAYMALDFIRGRELLAIVEDPRVALTPKQVKHVLIKVLNAVRYIHENNVLHRDISPDNILIQANGNPVLIDFGAAREEASKGSRILSQIHVVKDGYSPQEFYIAGSKQDCSCDLYSVAATFYHVITGTAPPSSQVRVAAIAAGKEDPYRPLVHHNHDYDEYFLGAIDQALCPFPKDRIQSADEWMERIDTIRRRKAALEQAKKDQTIEASIQALVAQTMDPDAADAPARRARTGAAAKKTGATAKKMPKRMPNTPVKKRATPAAKKPVAPTANATDTMTIIKQRGMNLWARLINRPKAKVLPPKQDTTRHP